MTRSVGCNARTVFVSIGFAFIFLLLWQPRVPCLYNEYRNAYESPNTLSSLSPAEKARNSTLGFERIVALSRGTAWRVHGLKAASQETGLTIEIPEQLHIDNAAIHALETTGPADVEKPSHGAAIAWVAHLDILRYTIKCDFSTALIIEDDVDWAVEIKDQMATLSDKVREFTKTSSANQDPYGDAWDVLWLGLCGEIWERDKVPPTLSWPDATAGRRADWRGIYETKWLMDLPEGHRSIYWSQSPLCTYAYAVSRKGAARVLEWASTGEAAAFDAKLQLGCYTKALRCISVVDQLFHHYRPPPEFGQGSDIGNIDKQIHSMPENEKLETAIGSTAVILHSARCKAMFATTCLDTVTVQERSYGY